MAQDEYVTEADVPPVETPAASAQMQAQLDAANARADENYNKFLLAMADFENYKKRTERRTEEMSAERERRLLLSFLPVVDNLERAIAFSSQNSEALLDGLHKTLRQFENALTMAKVAPIEVKGKPFDPATAEAIGTQNADGVDEDTVVEEAQKGYMRGDELLRPAKVIVAKNEL